MTLFTIGFTKTTAEEFFAKLRDAGVKTVLDARIHRDGQLSGFAKLPDLRYFLTELARSGYEPLTSLAPTASLLKSYRDKELSWEQYAQAYRKLLEERQPDRQIDPALLAHGCLLCSEKSPDKCHRRIAAEYLRDAFADTHRIEIVHL